MPEAEAGRVWSMVTVPVCCGYDWTKAAMAKLICSLNGLAYSI